MEIKVKVKKIGEILEDFKKKAEIGSYLVEWSNKVLNTAKDLCPVDTGRLKNSIKTKNKKYKNNVSITIYTNVHYAPYVEFGTGIRGAGSYPYEDEIGVDLKYGIRNGQVAQPFLYPALKLNEDDILREFKNKLKE